MTFFLCQRPQSWLRRETQGQRAGQLQLQPPCAIENCTGMEVPEDWGQRKRNVLAGASMAAPGGSVGGALAEAGSACAVSVKRSARAVNAEELSAFANSAAVTHVSLNSQFLRSIGNDSSSICGRILGLLPDHEKEASRKRKAPSAEDAEPPGEGVPPQRYDMRLELDTLLSRLPYKRMMQDIMPHNMESSVPSVPYVSRVYEESFMREPLNAGERQCVMGEECECMFIDRKHQFIGVEFLVPGEEAGETPQMCVLCSRAATQQLFYDIVFDNVSFSGLIQRYGNLHDVPNEYAKDAMLICPPNGPLHCMPAPILSHQRNRYTVSKISGVSYLRQHGVYFQ